MWVPLQELLYSLIGVIPKKNTHLDALAMLCWIRKVDNQQYIIKIDYKKKKKLSKISESCNIGFN